MLKEGSIPELRKCQSRKTYTHLRNVSLAKLNISEDMLKSWFKHHTMRRPYDANYVPLQGVFLNKKR